MFGESEFPTCAEERVIELLTYAEECVIEFPICKKCEVPSSKEVLQRMFQGEKFNGEVHEERERSYAGLDILSHCQLSE